MAKQLIQRKPGSRRCTVSKKEQIIEKLKDSLDCNLYFFGSQVNIGTMYMILGITILVLIGIYILLNKSKKYNR